VKYFVDAGEDRHLDAAARAGLRGDFLRLTDGITHVELSGPTDGDIIVLTGGITVPLTYWDDTVLALHRNGFRTLTFSAYGRGHSDRVTASYDADLFVRQMSDVIDAVAPGPFHLVGASMGALVAMEYVRTNSGSAATLALLGPAGLARRPVVHRALSAGLVSRPVVRHLGRRIFDHHQGRNVSDPVLAKRLTTMVDDAYRYEGSLYAFFQTLQHFPLFDRAELYRATDAAGLPTLLVWGTDDRVTPIDALEKVREMLHPDRIHVVEDCGHMVPLERPALVAEQLTTFITSHRSVNP